MRSRCGKWKARAYEYVKENGPCTSNRLLNEVVTSARNGYKPFTVGAPRNASHVFQLLKGDKRFSRKMVENRGTLCKYKVVEWSAVDEE